MPQESKLSQKVCIFGEETYFPTSTKLNKGDSLLLLCFYNLYRLHLNNPHDTRSCVNNIADTKTESSPQRKLGGKTKMTKE